MKKRLKLYNTTTKRIYWDMDGKFLNLRIYIDQTKFDTYNYKLPPEELGVCHDWHYEFQNNDTDILFVSRWDIRRVKNKMSVINDIIYHIEYFATNKSSQT